MNDIRVGNKKVRVGFKGIIQTVDESLLSHEYAKECDNFSFDNGVLKSNLGLDRAKGYFRFPNTNRHTYPECPPNKPARRVFLYRRKENGEDADRIVVQLLDGTAWHTKLYENDEWHMYPGVQIIDNAQAVNYNYNGEDVMILCSSTNDKMFFLNGDDAKVCSAAPHFSCIAVHNERVYGGFNGEQTRLWFSDDFNPANWNVSTTEAGYIDFADGMGDILKLISFQNYLYIFREYGIYRLTAYGDPSDFILKKVITDTGRLCKDSIVQCGDRIVFYAGNGLFSFDGYTATPIGKELPPLYSTFYMCGAYLDNCYYLACRTKNDEFLNNSLIKYDLKQNQYSILYGVQIRYMTAVKSRYGADIVCTLEDDNGYVLGMITKSGKALKETTTKHYASPYNNMSIAGFKTVKSIALVSKYPITLTVILDGKRYVFDVEGKEEMQIVTVEKSGREFGVEIDTTAQNAYVTPLIVDMDVMAE